MVAAHKLADLVLWRPAFFGVKPEMVVKGGFIAWSVMGDANASIPTPQPVLPRPMRAFQGWRYFAESDVPPDLGSMGAGVAAMPEPLRRELRDLGLL